MKVLWLNFSDSRLPLLPLLNQSEFHIVQLRSVSSPTTTDPCSDCIEIQFRGQKGKGRILVDPAFIRSFSTIMTAHKPVLVHLSGDRRPLLHAMIAMMRFPGVPVLVDRGANRGLNILSPLDWIGFFGRRNQAVLCASEAMRAYFAGHPTLGWVMPPKRLEVLHRCKVPVPEADLSRDAARAELGIPADAFVVGTICTVRPIKNLGVVAEAVALLRPLIPNIRFAVIGPHPDAAEVRRIQHRGKDLLMLFGLHWGARHLLKAFDVFVSPTRFDGEGFGHAIAEAMQAALPVVTSHYGAGPELTGQGAAGLVAGAHDVDAWRRAILLLARDPALRARLGSAAKARADHLFSPEVLAPQLLEIYRRRIASAPGQLPG
jgi:glycosyltransferase involved in cell wall biosynthesis